MKILRPISLTLIFYLTVSCGNSQTEVLLDDTESNSDSDSDTDIDTDSDTDIDTDSDTDTDTDTDIDTDSDTDSDTDTDTDTDSDTDTDTDSDMDTSTDYTDQDSDGWIEGIDCDDEDPDANQSEEEIYDPPNGVDEDCDGLTDEEPTDTDTQEEYPPYLLHAADSNSTLNYISIETAEVTELCEIRDVETGELISGGGLGHGLASLTFNREDRLLLSDGYHLWEIYLPSCDAEKLGDISPGQVFGIAPAEEGNGLLGISATSDELLRIDEYDGSTTVVGSLGSDWFTHGATWNDNDSILYGIRSADDGLYDISVDTGGASLVNTLDVDFGNTGVEYHPKNGNIYACTNDGNLYLVHPEDGSTEVVGVTGLTKCANLGAPHGDPPLPDVT